MFFRESLNEEDCVWVDETGVQDCDVRRQYGRAPGSQRARVVQQYTAGTRVSFVGALTVNGMLPCTMPFRVTMKPGRIFEWWCLHILLPCLHPGQTVVMDNAFFHRKNILRVLFAEAGVHFLFTPFHSPEFNPIELVWGYMKTILNRYATLLFLEVPYKTAYCF